MKKYLFLLVCLSMISSNVFAESVLDLCTTEAKEVGFEDPTEFQNYVNECVEQMHEEQNTQENTAAEDGDESDKGLAATE